ncbi:MAG: hypothetical protein E6Q76_15910 [Rhizobium sp.]|nr:MAG: hypothetical protein E6Q76_15910 [Rhizobium sp.]
MNSIYLTRFWGSDYHVILDAADIGRSLTPLWVDIATADQSRRLEAFRACAKSSFICQQRAAFLWRETTDAYLVKVRDDVALVADQQADDQVLSCKGFAPTGKSMFGGSVGTFYRALDGFCDFHFIGGLLPEREISPSNLGENSCRSPVLGQSQL